MGKLNARYVAKPYNGGWRIWNRRTKSWWGNQIGVFPSLMLNELNGEKRPDIIRELTKRER